MGSGRVSGRPQGRAGQRVSPRTPSWAHSQDPWAQTPPSGPNPTTGESWGYVLRGNSPPQGSVGAGRSNTRSSPQGLAESGAEMLRGQRETQAAGL